MAKSRSFATRHLKKRGRFPLIDFEGLDASGKSTIAPLVAREIGGVVLRCPPSELAEIRPYFDSQPSLETRFLYYLLCARVVSGKASEVLVEQPVILDRYYYTTIVSHTAAGIDEEFLGLIPVFDLLEPDLIFCFDCSDEVERERRLLKRGKTLNDVKFAPLREKIRGIYLAIPNIIYLDTASRSLKDVVGEVVAHIYKRTI
jgi:thymidylate kinase